ncbi:MAG: hypothetical protein AAFN51_07810 [Pseudomonadota bacterium]
MTRILIACALFALIIFGIVEMMIVVGMEPVHNALLNSFDLGFPLLETGIALILLAYLISRHPSFRRVPVYHTR